MVIKILGSGCRNCTMLADNAKAALAELGIDAVVEKVTDFAQIAQYGIMGMPGLVIDEKVVSSGRVLSAGEIARLIKNEAR